MDISNNKDILDSGNLLVEERNNKDNNNNKAASRPIIRLDNKVLISS